MIQTVDIFKQIAANLTANVVIDNAVDNLNGTFTLETTNTQWISELEIYSIGGFDYKIESLIQNVSLTISPVSNGALPTATGFVIPAPTFINGTLKMAKNEVDAIKNKMDLVPFIYLFEVIRDRKNTDDESTVERECDLRFFFINSSSFQNMLTEDVYEKVIYPLHPLVELFITKIKASPLFTDVLNYDEINLINFSEEGNQINSVFDLNLSAIELRLQAEIRSVNCDDIYTNPNPTCLPVRITDENVVVEVAAGGAYTCSNSEPCVDAILEINETEIISIPSGDTFDLTVTLDGTPSGTYNEATDTWEVESEPCADATYTIKDRDENTLYSGSISSGGNLNQYIENTTVEVNDSSFADVPAQGSINIQVVNSENTQKGSKVGSDWLLPNININKSDSTLIATIPSVKDYNVADSAVTVNGNAYANVKATDGLDIPVEYENGTPVGTINAGVVEIPNPIVPSGIAYCRPQPTGQTTIYRTGDNGDHLALGTYDYTPPPYPIHTVKLVNFVTLENNNIYGNTLRFTDELGTQVFANGVFIDHFTKLMWAILRSFGNFNDSIDYANNYIDALGNSDYRLANENEKNSIYDVENLGFNYAPLNTFWTYSGTNYHTSTTNKFATTENIKSNRDDKSFGSLKTTGAFGVMVRNWEG